MAIMINKMDRNNSSKASKAVNPLFGRRVLVVDDNPNQRKKLRELYESMGFICVGEAANGLECVELAEKAKPHLVSLDILMPLMHGVEALGYVKDANPESVVVFVSAMGSMEEVMELRSRGHAPDAVFSKKDTREMFIEVLHEIFEVEEDQWTGEGDGPVSSPPLKDATKTA